MITENLKQYEVKTEADEPFDVNLLIQMIECLFKDGSYCEGKALTDNSKLVLQCIIGMFGLFRYEDF